MTEKPRTLLAKIGITPVQLIIIIILLGNLLLAMTNHQQLDSTALQLQSVSAQACPPTRQQSAFLLTSTP